MRPNVAKRYIRISIYPKHYTEAAPNFILDIDTKSINCRPVKSRTKANVFGVLWNDELNKKCQIFVAFENKGVRQKFSEYFEGLLKPYSTDGSTTENGK